MSIFGSLFGRSSDMQRLDDALRTVGVKPRAIPDAVKIATLKQLKESRGGREADARACAPAAELLGYCILGFEEFAKSNNTVLIEEVETRLRTAIEAGSGLDARLVLLTLHAGLTHDNVIARYELSVG